MDRRLVFRPYPRSLKPQGPRAATSAYYWIYVPALLKGGGGSRDYGQSNWGGPGLARKACGGERGYPYRKPTLVGGCKCTKVGERTFVKELGNLTP
jgi:hypothetical protein